MFRDCIISAQHSSHIHVLGARTRLCVNAFGSSNGEEDQSRGVTVLGESTNVYPPDSRRFGFDGRVLDALEGCWDRSMYCFMDQKKSARVGGDGH